MTRQEIRVDGDGATLVGSYSAAGSTAVIAVHGAEQGCRGWYLYEHLHDVLPAAGIGVLTFDRRGEGESTGDPSRGRFDVQADDVLAFADALKVDRVALWGFSQGGWVAPVAAARSRRICALVLVASTGVTPAEQMRYAVTEQLRRAGFSQDVVERALRLRAGAERWIRGEDAGSLADELAAAALEPWWSLAFLPDSLPPGDASAMREDLAAELFFDPQPIFDQVRAGTLLFYGDDDSWTPVDASVRAWQRSTERDLEVVVLPGTGHEPTLGDGTLSPQYERKLIAWLRTAAEAATA